MSSRGRDGRISWTRRALDIVAAGTALVVLAPLLVGIAVLVRLTSRGPVLFAQTRLTTGHRDFTIYKFRTMRVDRGGPDFTVPGDARVTRVGAILRRTSLDELPQLLNVLRGQMTLVGPRPETPTLAALYPPELRFVLHATPGLTGPAQLRLRDRVCFPPELGDPTQWYIEHVVPPRVAADMSYLRAPSLRATLRIIVETVTYLVSGNPPPDPAGG
ncbi:MAG: sugar transferase [Dermatophilaceae bacterium]